MTSPAPEAPLRVVAVTYSPGETLDGFVESLATATSAPWITTTSFPVRTRGDRFWRAHRLQIEDVIGRPCCREVVFADFECGNSLHAIRGVQFVLSRRLVNETCVAVVPMDGSCR